MKKKNGFIAISIIYSFFLCFTMLMAGMLANYASAKIILNKASEPLIYEAKEEEPEPVIPDEPINKGTYLKDKIMEDNKDNYNFKNMEDFDGLSYYFSGNVKNNYISYANKTWRIVRINGDNSVRLVLNSPINYEDIDETKIKKYKCNTDKKEYLSCPYWDSNGDTASFLRCVGFTMNTYNDKPCTEEKPCEVTYNPTIKLFNNEERILSNSYIKLILEEWYKNKITSQDDKDIVYGTFCNDTSYFTSYDSTYDKVPTYWPFHETYHSAYARVNDFKDGNFQKYTLKCDYAHGNSSKVISDYGGSYKLKIGLMTIDEALLAGISIDKHSKESCENPNSYLSLNKIDEYGQCKEEELEYWTMTPAVSHKQFIEGNVFRQYTIYTFGHGSIGGMISTKVVHKTDSNEVWSGNWAGTFTSITTSYNRDLVIRPVINVKGELLVSGTGTETDPYIEVS